MGKKRPMRRKERLLLLVVTLLALVGVGVAASFLLPLACSSPGERRLIGSWELEPAKAPAPAGAKGPDGAGPPSKGGAAGDEARLAEFFKKMGKAMESWSTSMTPEMRVTFDRDGTYTESMGLGGRRQVVRGRWEVAEGGEDEVTVRVYPDDDDRTRSTELSISFEGDDVMLYPGSAGQPLRMVRRKGR